MGSSMDYSNIQFDAETLLKNPKEAVEFNSATNELIREASAVLISGTRTKSAEAWGLLANQVVGSENL